MTKVQHIFELAGGLGNQLFQICAAKHLSEHPKFDISMLRPPFLRHPVDLGGLVDSCDLIDTAASEGLTQWRLKNAFFTRIAKHGNFRKVGSRVMVEDTENSYLELKKMIQASSRPLRIRGYFQDSEFVTVEQIEFFRHRICPESIVDLNKLRLNLDSPSTALHYRLGDYTTLGKSLPSTYFEKALGQLHDQGYLHERILVFSDNLATAMQLIGDVGKKFKKKIQPVETSTPREMIALFGLSNSAVISNSTLAWWATKLSQTIEKVVSPSDWRSGSQKPKILEPEWITIDD